MFFFLQFFINVGEDIFNKNLLKNNSLKYVKHHIDQYTNMKSKLKKKKQFTVLLQIKTSVYIDLIFKASAIWADAF